MARYQCSVCGYVHDSSGPGHRWDELPDDWTCPVCGAAKSQFHAVGGDQPSSGTVSVSDKSEVQVAQPTSRVVVAHRLFGYVFLAIYLLLMVQMVPRLWNYQIEFPARTVVHISLGMAIGATLIIKIGVVRFFRRLDQALVPMLGTFLLVGSVVLIGISVPSALREALATGRLFTEENRQRIQLQLAQVGLDSTQSEAMASTNALRAGQRILRRDCIECHDLRTVLARPRTPQNWRQTVSRMADRTTLSRRLDEEQQWQVTAYLIALSPQLQKSTQQLRDREQLRDQSRQAIDEVSTEPVDTSSYGAAAARQLFDDKCSQCHDTSLVSDVPPGSTDEARELVSRMVEEGLEATRDELEQIVHYLAETYAKAAE